MARACVFCNASPVTAEHVIPEWVSPLFSGYGTGSAQLRGADGSEHGFPAKFFDHKVKVVCGTCNSGWMSALERQVTNTLGPMFRYGRETKLLPEMQHLLATWAIKTAYMLQYIHPRTRVVPDSEYASLYANRQPGRANAVWMGYRDDLRDETGLLALLKSRGEIITRLNSAVEIEALRRHSYTGHRAYRITFTIGHVFFAIVGHNFPTLIEMGALNEKVLHQIWRVDKAINWPPPLSIEAVGGFESVHEGLGDGPADTD